MLLPVILSRSIHAQQVLVKPSPSCPGNSVIHPLISFSPSLFPFPGPSLLFPGITFQITTCICLHLFSAYEGTRLSPTEGTVKYERSSQALGKGYWHKGENLTFLQLFHYRSTPICSAGIVKHQSWKRYATNRLHVLERKKRMVANARTSVLVSGIWISVCCYLVMPLRCSMFSLRISESNYPRIWGLHVEPNRNTYLDENKMGVS